LLVFEGVQSKLEGTLKALKGQAKIRENHIEDALKEIRSSLLEADVQFGVVKRFLEQVKTRALGAKVSSSLTPYQEFLKILHEEMLSILGEEEDFSLSFKPPVVILMAGLQGSGKTTTSGKLAQLAKKKLKRKTRIFPFHLQRRYEQKIVNLSPFCFLPLPINKEISYVKSVKSL